ncbi:hypothetical protein C8Q73DRAFT_276978 [Cubamyces lactineus]|nr:hypothetical protein C8Q73DRAFT_276978 [Cubamyces lactineus]
MGSPTSNAVPTMLLITLLAACISGADAGVNRTIDDQKGDSVTGVVPLFLPAGTWNIGQTCTSCNIQSGRPIDPGQVFDGTWHDLTHFGNGNSGMVQVSFTGHAVYVYNMIMNVLVSGAYTSTNLTFLIDSDYVGSYVHSPTSNDSTPAVFYQTLVYSNDTLEQGEHTLQMMASGDTTSLILFDYIMYTTVEDDESQAIPSRPFGSQLQPPQSSDESSASHQPDTHTAEIGAIVGGIAAGVASVACLLYLLHRCRIRRHQGERVCAEPQPEPHDLSYQARDPTGTPLMPDKEPSLLSITDALWASPPTEPLPGSQPGGTARVAPQPERLALLAQHITTLQAQVSKIHSLRTEERRSGCEEKRMRGEADAILYSVEEHQRPKRVRQLCLWRCGKKWRTCARSSGSSTTATSRTGFLLRTMLEELHIDGCMVSGWQAN